MSSDRGFFYIFDFDGTMVDSVWLQKEAEALLKCDLGFPTTTQEQIDMFAGIGPKEQMQHPRSPKLPGDFPDRAIEKIWRLAEQQLQPISGVESMLQTVLGRACIASNSPKAWVEFGLKRVKLDRFNLKIFSPSEKIRPKPFPDIFIQAAKEHGVHPNDCLVFEDSDTGIEAALAAGMRVVGVTAGKHCGPTYSNRLLMAGAYKTISCLSEFVPD